ncbi:hypothetical protein SLS62_005282 [Diatrype stigma]|uniref:Uncharacterized protein n=1 Tax=Diatrype stigma TaxID=117547 RepID=A0AAN9UPV7_9PEZI
MDATITNGLDSSSSNGSSGSTTSDNQAQYCRVKTIPFVLNGSSSSRRPPKDSHEAYPGYTHPQQRGLNYIIEESRPLNPQSNYRGREDLLENHSDCIRVEESTSLWITKLPPHCDYKMLLGSVRGCGKVHETVINPPIPERGLTTAACKLVFFQRHGVDNLLAQSAGGAFKIMGYTPHVAMNKILKKPKMPSDESRVLLISGPSLIVNTTFLTNFFQAHFDFNLEEVKTLWCNDHQLYDQRTCQEWRFGSYRNQAKIAYGKIESIQAEKRAQDAGSMASWMWSMVYVEYGPDPCGA